MTCSILSKPLVCGLFGPHPHAHRTKFVMCGARTSTPFFAPARAHAHAHFFKKKFQNFFFLNFLLLKIKFFYKKESVRTCDAHPHLRGTHAHTPARTFLKITPHPFAQKSPHPHVCACARTHAH